MLEDLLDASRRMTASLDTAEVGAIALMEAKRLVGAEGGLLAIRSDAGLSPLHFSPTSLFDLDGLSTCSLMRVVETGRSVVQLATDEPVLVEVPMAMAAVPVVADGVVADGVVADGVVAGAIMVVRVPSRPFERPDMDALEMLAPLVGSALQIRRSRVLCLASGR
ncbi:MAG: GAF domain-containing protein [Acidimicrobiales bacterium]